MDDALNTLFFSVASVGLVKLVEIANYYRVVCMELALIHTSVNVCQAGLDFFAIEVRNLQ